MNNADIITKAISSSLSIIEQEREREIISRRFGLSGHKETLEQIGEMLSITRERVRQLEKAILIRLRIAAEEGKISELAPAEKLIVRNLTEMGRVARASDLAKKILGHEANAVEKANFSFLGEISPVLTIVSENDKYHNAIGIAEYGDEKSIRSKVKLRTKNPKSIFLLMRKTLSNLTGGGRKKKTGLVLILRSPQI